MNATRKPIIGLIGSIGAGKSTVAALLAERGGCVIDADALGHQVLDMPHVIGELVSRWGLTIIKPDGRAHRRAIGAIVFENERERKTLETIVFPEIRRRTCEELARLQDDPQCRFIVLDAAVLLEAGWSRDVDFVVYVDAPWAIRQERVARRNGWSPAELSAREKSQWPAATKRARADAIIENDGNRDELIRPIESLVARWGLGSKVL
jgi:dephospho-CoA kinase